MKKIILILVSIFLFVNTSEAITIKDYKVFKKQDPKGLEAYVLGIFNGISTSNVWAERRNLFSNKGLYCIPRELVLNVQNIMTLIEEQHQIDIQNDIANLYEQRVSILLIHRLESVFPCD